MENGYYLIKDTKADALCCWDIAAYDDVTDTWTFCGDDYVWPNNGRFEVVKYVCNPECDELRG